MSAATRPQGTFEEAQQVIKDGGAVIFWREGCPFCKKLDVHLGELGDRATWVNVWEVDGASDYVKSLHDGNEIVPTFATAEKKFVVANENNRIEAASLLEKVGA